MTDPGYPPEATAALAAGTQTALAQAVVEIEQYVAAGGWDAPVRVLALVGTAHVPVRAPDTLRTRSGRAPTPTTRASRSVLPWSLG